MMSERPTPQPDPPLPATHAVIDWQEALERMDGDAALLQEVCAIFLADAPEIRARLASAAEARDRVQLQYAAHSLKGSSATLSAVEVAELAGRLEHSARDGDLEEAAGVAAGTLAAFDRLLDALRGAPGQERRTA